VSTARAKLTSKRRAGIWRPLRARIRTRTSGDNAVLCCKSREVSCTQTVAEGSKLMQGECELYENEWGVGEEEWGSEQMHTLDDSIGKARGHTGVFCLFIASLARGHHRRGARDDIARPCISSGFHDTRCIASAKSTHSRRLSLLSNQSASRLATSSS